MKLISPRSLILLIFIVHLTRSSLKYVRLLHKTVLWLPSHADVDLNSCALSDRQVLGLYGARWRALNARSPRCPACRQESVTAAPLPGSSSRPHRQRGGLLQNCTAVSQRLSKQACRAKSRTQAAPGNKQSERERGRRGRARKEREGFDFRKPRRKLTIKKRSRATALLI